MRRLHKVEGNPDLGRDPISGAVINLNTSEFEKFMEDRRRRAAFDDMNRRMCIVEGSLQRIENLMLELLSIRK